MNIRVYFNCKRRNHIVEDTTLNGRYQVQYESSFLAIPITTFQIKEVYAITRAMLPVYCIGSVVKVGIEK